MAGDKKTLSCGIGHCFLHDHSIKVAKIALVFSAVCCLLISCAPAHKTVMQPPIPHRSTIPDKSFIDNLKDFHLEILTENHGLCPGRDGKNMIFWGRDARLQLVLTFSQIPPTDVRPDDLVARIELIPNLSFPFALRSSEKVFMTDITNLNSLQHGLDTGPTGISIFYKGRDGEVFLGTQGRLAIDTIPPKAPINLRVTDSGPSYFSLTWEYVPGDIKEYCVEKWDSGEWLTIRSGFRSPPVRIKLRPEGRFRIVAVDCALNRAISDEVWVEYITIKKKDCGENRTAAYRNAQDMVNEQFVSQYVRPGLISHSDLNQREVDRMIANDPKGWVPPGIHFTPEDKAEYNSEGNEYCARVTGRLSRKTLQRWIQDSSGEINTQRRHGIRVRISGPGSDILEEYFKNEAGSRGYVVYKDEEFLPVEPLYILDMDVTLGKPRSLRIADLTMNCWHVHASMSFTNRAAGRNIHLTLRDVAEIDPRIYGLNREQALNGQGLNSFPERIASPLIKEFFRQFDHLLPNRQEREGRRKTSLHVAQDLTERLS